MGKNLDITGRRYGRLLVVRFSHTHKTSGGNTNNKWECLCDCGNTAIVSTSKLTRGHTKSCGCYQKDKVTKHGMSKTPEYRIWEGLIHRCKNPNSKKYHLYGGAGIEVSEEWETFENFYRDMGDKPSNDRYTLGRVDGSLGYCKENCRWETYNQQNRNLSKRSTNITGKTGVSRYKDGRYVAKWCDIEGVNHSKSFAIGKYGEELAFFMACEYRDQQILLLNLQGAGYSKHHGRVKL